MTSKTSIIHNNSAYIDFNEFYTSCKFKPIIKRHCEYLREHPYTDLSGYAFPMALIAAGGAVGFMTGTTVADVLKVDKKARLVLQGSCTVAGGAAGAIAYVSIAENSLYFKTWKFLKLTQPTLDFVFKNHAKDDFLNQFLDCIHYTPIVVPVRLSSAYLIDLDTLKTTNRNKDGNILCPHTREVLDLKNPKIDLESYTLILKRFQYLLQQDLTRLEVGSEDYHATMLQLEVIETNVCLVHEKHLKGLEQLRSNDKITAVEYNRLVTQFCGHFGINPTGKADPANDIEAHVMDFTLDWKKIISDHSKIIFKGTPPTQFIEDV